MADREARKAFREGQHYVPIAGLPEWESRQRSYVVEEQMRWREIIDKADRDGYIIKCISCTEILSKRNRNVQVLEDDRVRCAGCRVK